MKENKSLGKAIDNLFLLDKAIDSAEDEVKALKSTRTKAETELLNKFKKADINNASGTRAKAKINHRRYPSIKDRKAFQKYVKQTNSFDLYQNRINGKAYFDRLEEGEQVPGITVFDSFKISVTKVRK